MIKILFDIIFWLAVAYIAIVVLYRLVMAIMMIIGGYAEAGFGGAIMQAAIVFLINLWSLAKFAFMMLIIVLVIRGCG